MGTFRRNKTANEGFTLIELVIVLVIVAIGVALAAPSYQDVMQRRELTSQAEGLAAFLSFAQSEAVKYNEMISVHINYTDSDNWCIGANEGNTACDCWEADTSAANFCSLNEVAKIMSSSSQTTSGMSATSTDRTLVFDPVRGIMVSDDLGSTHDLTLESDNGNWTLLVAIEVTGRVRICNPESTKAVPGYQPCPAPPPPPPPPGM